MLLASHTEAFSLRNQDGSNFPGIHVMSQSPKDSSTRLYGFHSAAQRLFFSQNEDDESFVVNAFSPSSVTEDFEIKPMYVLPKLGPEMSELQNEFRHILEGFGQYTELDLYTIPDPSIRSVLEGVVASSSEPAVYRAFEVLYEDVLPIRVAGRMIARRIDKILHKAKELSDLEVDKVVKLTQLSRRHVEASRLAFLTFATVEDDEAFLTTAQLVDLGLAHRAVELLQYDGVDEFLATIDPDKKGRVTFEDLLIGIQNCVNEECVLDCNPAEVLRALALEIEPNQGRNERELTKKQIKFNDKYDYMVDCFKEWQDVIPSGEGRRLEILRGCFVGAENPKVVEALRVLYVDYIPLRLAGNTIFSLVSALINQAKRARENQH